MHPKRLESRSSQLPALISHLGALISHLTLPPVSCQISRLDDDGGGARWAACNDEICLCTTIVEGPLSPTVYRLAMCCGRHRARRRYQVSCSTREMQMQMLVREGD
jgi:hypothetical protein